MSVFFLPVGYSFGLCAGLDVQAGCAFFWGDFMGVHVLNDLECVSKDCVKCHFDTDVSFYVRLSYLEQYNVDDAAPGVELSDEEFADFVQAGSAFAAEKCAVEYLASREHSRYQLRLKLLKKANSEEASNKALDFLEREGWLSDRRFAEEWLRSRGAHHNEGRSRLMRELQSRGINKVLASEAVERFFEDTPEEKQLEKAYKKLSKQGKDGEKLINALIRLGFSNKMIKEFLKTR